MDELVRNGNYELHTGDNKGPIKARDLEKFLDDFGDIYATAIDFLKYEEDNFVSIQAELSSDSVEKVVLKKFKKFVHLTYPHQNHHRRDDQEDYEWVFDQISTNSPIKFIGYCTGISLLALSLSVAAAGGEADLRKMVFKVGGLLESSRNISSFRRF